jgi:predicted PurR-regulated permease PerM
MRWLPAALTLVSLATLCWLAWQVVQPFVVSGLWAVVLVVVSWPGMLWLQQRLGGRRWLAITLLTLALLLLVVIPVTLAITAAVVNAAELVEQLKGLADMRLPALPSWLTGLPFVGPKLLLLWQELAAAGLDGVLARLAPYAGTFTRRVLTEASGFGFVLVEFALTLGFATLLWARGEDAAAWVQDIARRLGGAQGLAAVALATQVVRGVALGVGGTAVVQSLLAGIGLALAGVPFTALLTALTFVLCVVQLGTPLVMVPAVAWLYWSGATVTASVLLVWSVIIGTTDNVIRPLMIQRGVDLPFWLVFVGVIGGLLAFGLIGLFIGPVVLAVAQMLLTHWLQGPPDAFKDTLPPR